MKEGEFTQSEMGVALKRPRLYGSYHANGFAGRVTGGLSCPVRIFYTFAR